MTAEHPQPGPEDWAKQERIKDLSWIGENLPMFMPLAAMAYRHLGRGALVVNTVEELKEGQHPIAYFPQHLVDSMKDDDIKRMVKEYQPADELVIVLLKKEARTSTYRVGLPKQQVPGTKFSLS